MRMARRGHGLLKFLFGFLCGILAIVIAVGGTIWWFYANFSMKKLEDWTGSDLVSGEGEEKTVAEWVTYFTREKDVSTLSLTDVKRLFGEKPFGLELFREDGTMFGIDVTAVMDLPLMQIPNNVGLLADAFTLNTLQRMIPSLVMPNLPLLQSAEVADAPLTQAFNVLSAHLNPQEVTFGGICADFGIELDGLADGLKNALTSVVVGKLGEELPPKMLSLTPADVLPEDQNTGILQSIWTTPFDRLSTRIETLELGEILQIDDATSSPMLLELRHASIKTLDQAVQNLSLEAVMGGADSVAGSSVLEALAYRKETDESGGIVTDGDGLPVIRKVTVSEVGARLKTVTIQEIFPGESADEGNFLSYLPENTTLDNIATNMSQAVKEMKITDITRFMGVAEVAATSPLGLFVAAYQAQNGGEEPTLQQIIEGLSQASAYPGV